MILIGLMVLAVISFVLIMIASNSEDKGTNESAAY